jgi:trimeric autotransporter adhesin
MKHALLFCLSLFSMMANAQTTASQLFDCNPGALGSNVFGHAKYACVGNKYFFVSRTTAAGTELWVTSGTAATTFMLKNIGPGANDANIDKLTPVGNFLYFFADDGNGRELWRTDGTSANTFMVKDAAIAGTFQGSTTALQFLEYNGKLMYTFDNGTNGAELWTSDGTAAGTNMVINLQTGPNPYNPALEAGAVIYRLIPFNGLVYFHANQGNMRSLWKTDGTAGGTIKIKDLRFDFSAQYVDSLSAMGDKLYFFGDDGTTGAELWVSDGTTAGTQLVKDIKQGTGGSYPSQFRKFGNYVYFTADSSTVSGTNDFQIWKTDGTAAGTTKVTTVPFTVSTFWGVHENKLLYSKYDASYNAIPWVLNTDNDNASILSANFINPSNTSAYRNGITYFAGKSPTVGAELWKTDGTTAGTVLLQDINPVNPGSFSDAGAQDPFVICGDLLYFMGNNNVTGIEPWTYYVGPTLPLKLLQFSGAYRGHEIVLNWTTANELGFSHFEVEHSANGIHFQQLGLVRANNANNYQLVDAQPFANENFYRLKMMDKDGWFTYSSIVRLQTKAAKVEWQVKKISNQSLQLQYQSVTAHALVQVYDVMGRMLASKTIGGNNGILLIELPSQATGVLQVVLRDAVSVDTKRVLF